ncbi:MAG: hypothetical protein ACLUFU_04750 [Bacilli bacterium]
MNDDVFNLLGENGFVIDKTGEFLKATENIDLKTVVDELVELKNAMDKKANEEVDVLTISKDIMNSVENIDFIIKGDELVKSSNEESLKRIDNAMAKFRESFRFIGEYIISERNLRQREEDYLAAKSDLENAIKNIDQRTDLTPALKTREVLRLKNAEEVCKKAYIQAFDLFIENKKHYENSIKNVDIREFKDILSNIVYDLERIINSLSLNSKNKNEIEKIIREMKSITSNQELQEQFDALCQKYSLKYVGKEEAMVKDEFVENVSESFERDHNIWTTPVEPIVPNPLDEKNPEKIEKKKNNINWLLDELKRLNPDNEFELEDTNSPVYDAKINCDKSIKELILPYGYYYLSNSITNRFSTDADILNVEIGTLEREVTASVTTEVVPEEVKPNKLEDSLPKPPVVLPENDFDQIRETPITEVMDLSEFENDPDYPEYKNDLGVPDFVINTEDVQNTASRIPANKKTKVTKTRRAKMAQGVKKLLTASAVVGIASGLALSSVALATLGGSALVIKKLISKEYRDNIKASGIVEPMLEEENMPETWQGLKKVIPAFQNGFKKAMSMIKNRPEEDLKDLDEQVEEVVGRGR